jgi:CRISPR/Cas system-associated exonuclease Cas4 (RecB family)
VRIDCVGASRTPALQEPPVGEGSGPRAALLDVSKSGNCILTVNIYSKSAVKKKKKKKKKVALGPKVHEVQALGPPT